MAGGEIIVLGATGYTGRLTVAELKRRELPMVLAGRSLERLTALRDAAGLSPDTRRIVADPTKPDTLPALFADKKEGERQILINCVGPFTKLGEPVVKAAIAAGVHYLDISGEQKFIAHIVDRYHARAIEAGCTVVPGCGAEYALTNWAGARSAHGLEPLVNIDTCTLMSNVKASRGTRLSIFEALSAPGVGWRYGRRVVRMAGSASRTFAFPDGPHRATLAPFGEVVTLPRHIDVQNMASYVVVPGFLVTSLRATFPIVPVVGDVLGITLGGFVRRGSDGPDAQQRKAGRWSVVAIASGPQGKRQVSLSGNDVYGLTAVILAYCAARMRDGAISKSGALGPAHAFDTDAALNYIQHEADVVVEVRELEGQESLSKGFL